MSSSVQDLLRQATRLTRAGRLGDATAAIRRALGRAAAGRAPVAPAWATQAAAPESAHEATPASAADVLEGFVFEVPGRASPQPPWRRTDAPDGPPAAFIDGSHTHASLTRRYKLYVPPGSGQQALPLVVMLHGCTQDPEDFAAGTGMNGLAAEHGVHVLYPEQAQDANPSRCWNWFKHNHQARDRGEAAVIATMAQAVMRTRRIDPGRVYICGMSAGGAMASLVAAAYPELFAAVGVHSGLAPGAARSLPEGLAAMRGGDGAPLPPVAAGMNGASRRPAGPATAAELPVPAIVFHGDRDATVHPRNGEQVVAAVLRSRLRPADGPEGRRPVVEQGVSARGRHYTRSTYRSEAGMLIAEHWLLHGGGHAWSGGHAAGSFTDAQGPDASREMLRFFLGQRRGPAG